MKTVKRLACLSLLFFILSINLLAGTTGKISGTVKDSRSGEPLVGVNILVEGIKLGASSGIDGSFVILNVPSGEYRVRASLVGYTATTMVGVRVFIDQTTEIKITLAEEAIQAQEVVVVAVRPVVQKDVASSTANISSTDIASLPVSTISAAVSLQAGIQSGLIIRGSNNADQTAFIVDGLTLRDERNNKPYSGISLSAVQDIQVQTGGFNAEYGNIRSGIVNVVTREGSPTKYFGTVTTRVSPPTAKNFGPSIFNQNSYFMRPFLDPAVAFIGTGANQEPGPWDKWTRQQYRTFVGWNAISQSSLADADPTNDLSPQAAQRLFMFQHRKQGDIVKPDYDIDAGFGGPVPFVSTNLGNLRFFASYRTQQTMYLLPLSDDAYRDYNGQLKVTSDISPSFKLMVQGMIGQQKGTSDNNAGTSGLFQTPEDIADNLNEANYADLQIFTDQYYCPSTVKLKSFGAKATHLLSATTFYEASVNYVDFNYSTNLGRLRDTTRRYLFGSNYYVDESPFGYVQQNNDFFFTPSFTNKYGQSGSRDTSKISNTTVKVDLSSQVNRYNQIKTGIELVFSHNNSNYATVNSVNNSATRSAWDKYPYRASLYVQDKFEYEGMIANLGVRMDLSNPNGNWYVYNPFSNGLYGGNDSLLTVAKIDKNVTFSPRLGVAFPITEYAKLFFNYGHFRSMPQPEDLFLVRHDPVSKSISRLANPNDPLPKTIAYELGYEHSLFEEYLIRVAGYYKNVSDQITTLSVLGSKVNYSVSVPSSYEDIRGVEVTVSRNRGEWITGLVNYTYMARSSGRFGYSQLSQSITDELNYEATHSNDLYQTKPVPQPYARLILDLFTPSDFMQNSIGIGGIGLLNNWRFNITAGWAAGAYDTWTGSRSLSLPDVQNNIQWRDTYTANIRLSKTFKMGTVNFELFADINNIFNIRNFAGSTVGGYGFTSIDDENSYWQSLHLPSSIVQARFNYINIPGDDRPGDVRKEGVAYQHIEPVNNLAQQTYIVPTAIYWEKSSGRYMENQGNGWTEVSSSRMNQIINDKAYIDMPNMDFLVFLNPRDVFWGLKVSFDL
jgi:hypothetical protein